MGLHRRFFCVFGMVVTFCGGVARGVAFFWWGGSGKLGAFFGGVGRADGKERFGRGEMSGFWGRGVFRRAVGRFWVDGKVW